MKEPVRNKKARVTWAAVKKNAGYAIKGLNSKGELVRMKELGVHMWMN